MKGEKLEKFTDRIMADVNAAMSCLNLYIGHRLNLFKALQLLGNTDAKELAEYSHTNPEAALKKMKDMLSEDGAVLISEEAVGDNLEENKNFLGHMMYNFCVLHCLPQSMVFPDSAAIGTVMNPSRLKELAVEAGFSSFEVLPVENDFWRFYQLKH